MERKGDLKLKQYLQLERRIQCAWETGRVNEADPPPDYSFSQDRREKFLVTFPFPYMNGRLHLGHSFSLSKSEVSVFLTGFFVFFLVGLIG